MALGCLPEAKKKIQPLLQSKSEILRHGAETQNEDIVLKLGAYVWFMFRWGRHLTTYYQLSTHQ